MNKITEYIIELTQELLSYEEELPWVPYETDAQSCETLVCQHFQSEYDECLSAIHTNMDYLNSVPVDFIPIRLFKAAIETGVSQIDWGAVAKDEKVQSELRRLEGKGDD